MGLVDNKTLNNFETNDLLSGKDSARRRLSANMHIYPGPSASEPTTSLKNKQLLDVNSRIKEVSQILNKKNPTSVIIKPSQEVVEETEAETFAQARSGLKETGTVAEDAIKLIMA